jgi:hypothetical protein
MIKDPHIVELTDLYCEMDPEGRRMMVTAAKKLLQTQKSMFIKERKPYHFTGISVYFMIGFLIVLTGYIFWINLISPALLMDGITPLVMARIILTALFGLFCLGVGLTGFLLRKMSIPLRFLAIAAGLGCLDPAVITDLIGFAFLALIVSIQLVQGKLEKAALAA